MALASGSINAVNLVVKFVSQSFSRLDTKSINLDNLLFYG